MGVGDASGIIPTDILRKLKVRGQAADAPPQRQRNTRAAFIFTSELWKQEENRGIVWQCNPSSVSWKLALRGAEQQTKTGRVTHNWIDQRRRTFYDEPELTFDFQTGNIFPIYLENSEVRIPDGLDNFYQLLELIQQTRILSDGRTNTITISYNSMIFPSITLRGLFKQDGISWTDTADTPNQVNSLTASFTVYDTVPHLFSADELIKTFNNMGLQRRS